jgi:hypothetical protein
MSWTPCTHWTPEDHSDMVDGVRHWRCSACGKRAPWGTGWVFHGADECTGDGDGRPDEVGTLPGCGSPVVNWVACSSACWARLAWPDIAR